MDLPETDSPLFPASNGPAESLLAMVEQLPPSVSAPVPPIRDESQTHAFATQAQLVVEQEDPPSEDDDDIAFAAEAAANAVEEADAEQQRLDQSLMTCRICGQGGVDGRPLLHFLPMDPAIVAVTSQALSPSASQPSTFSDHICLHVFCGKTASILPSVCRPELEILTKAGLKNKHGIGAEVNAALARTRCAAPLSIQEKNDLLAQKQDKQFYLAKEFEAHLAAIRISAASVLDLPDDSRLNFDLLAVHPPVQPLTKKGSNKRKRSRSTGHGQPLARAIAGEIASQAPSNIFALPPQPVHNGVPLQIGSISKTTSISSSLRAPAREDMQQMQPHLDQQIIARQNGLVVQSNTERNNTQSNAIIGQSGSTNMFPNNMFPQIMANSGKLLHQVSPMLMFPGQHQNHRRSSGRHKIMERLPRMRAAPLPLQLPPAQVTPGNRVTAAAAAATEKARIGWNGATMSSGKGCLNLRLDSAVSQAKQLGVPSSMQPGTVTTIKENGEVRCDCGGTFQPEEDANGVLGWQSHFSTSRHQQWMANGRNGTGNQSCHK